MKKKNKTLIIITCVVLAFYICIIGMFILDKIKTNIQHKKEIENYRQMVISYLDNKYNKNFNVEFSSEGFKSKGFSIDGSYGECGHDKNIKEYVFKVTNDDLPVESYITVWKNIETEEINIVEVNGANSNKADTSYEYELELYNEKKEVKAGLEKILNGNYQDYLVTEDNEKKTQINIILKENITEEIKNDLQNINSMIQLLKDKKIVLIVKYADFTRKYDNYSNINTEKQFVECAKETVEYMKDNFKTEYSIESNENYLISVNIPINIKEEYYTTSKDIYEKLFKDLYSISIKNDTSMILEFNDEQLWIGKYYKDNLEAYSNYWK